MRNNPLALDAHIRLNGWLPVLAFAIAAAGCDSPSTPLKAEDIERAARDTASLAAEASLLVKEIEQGNVGATYIWVHQQALLEESAKAAEPLRKPVPPDLREREQQLLAANARLAAGLGQIGFATTNPGELHRLGESFGAIAPQAQALKGNQ